MRGREVVKRRERCRPKVVTRLVAADTDLGEFKVVHHIVEETGQADGGGLRSLRERNTNRRIASHTVVEVQNRCRIQGIHHIQRCVAVVINGWTVPASRSANIPELVEIGIFAGLVGEPDESPQFVREVVVEPEVELVIGASGGACGAPVVGLQSLVRNRCRAVGQRPVRHQLLRNRINPAGRNDVVSKRLPEAKRCGGGAG